MEFKVVPADEYEALYKHMEKDFPLPGELAPFHAIKRNLESGRYEGFYLYDDIKKSWLYGSYSTRKHGTGFR